jgi:hypothetical protein
MLIFEKKQASTHEKMRSMNKLKKQKKKKKCQERRDKDIGETTADHHHSRYTNEKANMKALPKQ